MRVAHTKAGRRALGAAAAGGVKHMAHRFIVGESPRSALPVPAAPVGRGHRLHRGPARRGDGHRGGGRPLRGALRGGARHARRGDRRAGPRSPLLESDSAGALPRVNLSVKVSALTPLLRPDAPEIGRDDAARRMRPLLRRARELGAHLHIDMESLDTLEATLELALELLAEEEFARRPVGRRGAPGLPARLAGHARGVCSTGRGATRRAQPLTVRLVKGAYWDHEVVEARQHGWSPPVFEVKADCDRNFEALTRELLDADGLVRVAVASHNLRSVSHAIAYAGEPRPGAPGAARPRRRAGRGARGQRAAGARLLPGRRPGGRAWRTWCAGCSRTPPTSRSWASSSGARPSRSCWRRHEPARRSATSRRSSCAARRSASRCSMRCGSWRGGCR